MKNLVILAKEWFDRVNGNSYFSATIHVDDKEPIILPFQYGYGEQYLHEAKNKLIELGYISEHDNQTWMRLTQYCREQGINLIYTKSEHCKKRDLAK